MAVTAYQERRIRELRQRGVGYRTIAAELGISRDTVRNFCTYLAHALCNVITLLNIRVIYVGIPTEAVNRVFESILTDCLNQRLKPLAQTEVQVCTSRLGVEAALYGTLAVVMEQVFEGNFFPHEPVADPSPMTGAPSALG